MRRTDERNQIKKLKSKAAEEELKKLRLQKIVLDIVDSNLKDSYKEVIVALCLLGLTQKEMAQILERSQGLISRRKNFAIDKVKEICKKYGKLETETQE